MNKLQTMLVQQNFNMQVICGIFFMYLMINGANTAASIGFYANPAYPGKCYINSTLIMSPGDVIYLPYCTKMSCDNERGQAYMVSCGVYAGPPNCTIFFPHAHMNYPDCCKVAFKCNHENEVLDRDEESTKPTLISKLVEKIKQKKTETQQKDVTEETSTVVIKPTEDNLDSSTTGTDYVSDTTILDENLSTTIAF